ncbi:MAG: potassium channel protein [Deltaproteobacteria bacterium]|nr:potassium channel protein [Deltaproteobacteria bacterium]
METSQALKGAASQAAAKRQRKRLAIILGLIALVMVFGTSGYTLLFNWPLLDAVYMTLITLTTIGFGEIRPMDDQTRIFTMMLVVFGVGVVGFSITSLGEMLIEAELGDLIWRRRMEKQIRGMHNHVIVCGYGRTGRAVVEGLQRMKTPFVVLESNPDGLSLLRELGLAHVAGDATEDDVLVSAGIARAKYLVSALGSDAENVYLILSARQMNPGLKIASWASSQAAEVKVTRAGADYVVSPYMLGGNRLVQHLLTPHAMGLLDRAIKGEDPGMRLEEIEIPAGSRFVGQSLHGLGIGRDLRVIVFGVRRGEDLRFNPSADTQFEAEDILIVVGGEDSLHKLRQLL